jgi:hypothetical protein
MRGRGQVVDEGRRRGHHGTGGHHAGGGRGGTEMAVW